MYLVHPAKMVYLANPRTGSSLLRRCLLDKELWKPGEVEEVADGKSPGDHHLWGVHHGIDQKIINRYAHKLCQQPRGYDIVAVVRNPWDHIVSWWHLHKKEHTFDEFINNFDDIVLYTLPEEFPNTVQILLHWADLLIEFEDFPKFFSKRFNKTIGWAHNSNRTESYQPLFTPQMRDKVAERYATEIEIYNYKF